MPVKLCSRAHHVIAYVSDGVRYDVEAKVVQVLGGHVEHSLVEQLAVFVDILSRKASINYKNNIIAGLKRKPYIN